MNKKYLENRLKEAEDILNNTIRLMEKYQEDNTLPLDKIIFEEQIKRIKEDLYKLEDKGMKQDE
nr:hypothetical protein [Methanobrevibacter arboriphilus]